MNNKKAVVALLLVAIIGIVGLTIAYFANSTSVDNTFITKEYGTEYTETFVSPDNWLPGDTTEKTLVATNTGEVDQAVRVLVTESWTTNNNGTLNGWIHSDGTKSTHTTQSELETDERVAVLNLANTSDWTKVGNYYYYNYKLAPTESTTSFLESVTFNPKTKLDDTCTETVNNGTRTITCNSSGDDYDNATYTLTLTIETVQYNKYNEAWNLNNSVTIAESKHQPVNFAQHIMNNANAITVTNYTDGVTTEAYTFEHDATEQTPVLTDYRYIGASPNNYVEFNCDDNGENCETWRAIGVFYVDDGNNNWEWRVKLVRENLIKYGSWNNVSNNNDWTDTDASLKNFLNIDYYNNLGDALANEYGLREMSRGMIGEAVYYLGGKIENSLQPYYGSANDMYVWERGNTLCGSCETDTTKLKWVGKVALMYPSDQFMVYANRVDEVCYNDPNDCREFDMNYSTYMYDKTRENPGYPNSGWLYNENIDQTWLLSPYSGSTRDVFYASGDFYYDDGVANSNVAVRPVLYLSSSVKTTSGDGSVDSPYKLSL